MARSTAEIERQLAALPLFAGIRKRALRRIAELVTPSHIDAGKLVLLEEHHGEQVHLITAGEATVTRHGDEIATLGAGELVGEMGVLDHADRNATVRAKSRVSLLTFGADDFEQLLQDHPEVAARVHASVEARRAAER